MGFTVRRVREPNEVADVVAATFVTVLSNSRRYDPDRGEPTAWLLGIAANLIANRDRRRQRETAATSRIAGRRLLDVDDIERLEERIDASRARDDVVVALAALSPRARQTLLLVGAEGLTSAEAARVLGISAAAFRMRLTAARRALARALSGSTARPASAAPIKEVIL